MDEKLRIEIDYILAEVANHSNRYPDEDDAAHAIEQAFRDAGWIEPQQPAEGELAGCPHLESSIKGCIHTGEPCSGDECLFTEGSKAQLAHDKQRMVPSEDELALWLCDHLSYTSRELAYELLRLLGGKK